jgi:hypothetical protein
MFNSQAGGGEKNVFTLFLSGKSRDFSALLMSKTPQQPFCSQYEIAKI